MQRISSLKEAWEEAYESAAEDAPLVLPDEETETL